MTAFLYCLSLTSVALAFYYIGRAHGSYHRDALNLEIGLLRAQRDEARIDADEKWGTVGFEAGYFTGTTHDDSHTLRPPKEEKP